MYNAVHTEKDLLYLVNREPLKPPRDDSALRALSSLRGLRGAPEVPPLCRETSVSRTANVGTWLRKRNGGPKWVIKSRLPGTGTKNCRELAK